jgi:transcriptional regulator with XRE-family HTH domain
MQLCEQYSDCKIGCQFLFCNLFLINGGVHLSTENKRFNCMEFYEALNTTREARNLNWKHVSGATSVGASTLTRMAQGKRPDADSLASLAAWSGLNPANFVDMSNKASQPEPLAMISTYLRSDPNLSDAGAIALEEMLKAAYKQFSTKK